jgi:ribosomal protein L32
MAVPKRKTTPSRKGMRQARHAKAAVGAFTADAATGSLRLRHHAGRDDAGAVTFRGKVIKAAKVKAADSADAPAAE